VSVKWWERLSSRDLQCRRSNNSRQKAAPTKIFQMPFVLTGFAPSDASPAAVPTRLRLTARYALVRFLKAMACALEDGPVQDTSCFI
jgi:hypothetical protein